MNGKINEWDLEAGYREHLRECAKENIMEIRRKSG